VFSAAAEAKTHPRRVVKLRLFSSCFEYPDFFVGNRIVRASESCFSRKVTSEVSPWGSVTDAVEKARRIAPAEGLPNVKTCSVYGITHPNVSYLSQKVMSEVSVSQGRRSPSARSALAAYVYSVILRIHFRSSRKARKTFWQKRSFFEEKFRRRGGSPLLAPEGGSGFAEARLTLP
jgi:hypothetical protein